MPPSSASPYISSKGPSCNFARPADLRAWSSSSTSVEEATRPLERLHHHGGDLETKGRVDVSANLTLHDDERLHTLITNHVKWTGSARGRQILENWDEFRPKFVKVMPVDYRRAMEEMEAQRMAVAAE